MVCAAPRLRGGRTVQMNTILSKKNSSLSLINAKKMICLGMSLIMGKEKVSRETVQRVVTPDATETFQPIPHSVARAVNPFTHRLEDPIGLVEMVEQGLLDAGFEIIEEDHVLARKNQCYFGGFSIIRHDIEGSERRLVCGVRNSHNKLFATSICIGSHMLVCDNLCFSSEQVVSRKHTPNIMRDLPDKINEVINSLIGEWLSMEARVDHYKRQYLTEKEAALIFNQLAETGSLPESKPYKAFKLWQDPAIAAKGIVNMTDFIDDNDWCDENAYEEAIAEKESELRAAFGCGNSLWGVYNAVTEILKGGNAQELPARTMKMQVLLDGLASFDAPVVGEQVADNGTGDLEQDEENFRETF